MPYKRRRMSADDEERLDSKDPVHRSYDPTRQNNRIPSRSHSVVSPTSRTFPVADSWQAPSNRGSPYPAPLASIQRGSQFEVTSRPAFNRGDFRTPPVTLPSLDSFDREGRRPSVVTQVPRQMSDVYQFERGSTSHSFSGSSSHYDSTHSTFTHNFSFGYPSGRGHSLPGPSTHHDSHRSPFTNGPNPAFGSHYEGYMAEGYAEGKQRKRRGNLPKETTDKLRAWFMGHLNHPYPTEDEKQELMRQTGLQMSTFLSLVISFKSKSKSKWLILN